MGRIKNKGLYPDDIVLDGNESLIGSDITNNGETKNYTLNSIRDFLIQGLSPEEGGVLKITEIIYSGELTTPEEVANQLDPVYLVQRYEVVILNVNGDKYLFQLQDVNIGVLEDDVSSTDFIAINLISENLSNDISFYKGFNPVTGREEHYSVNSVGLNIAKEMSGLDETGVILIEQTEQTNLGTGVSVYKGLNSTTKLQEFRRISSDTQIIELDGDTILINTPSTASIPALYVNDLYIPTYNDWLTENEFQNSGTAVIGFIFRGKGTLAQPFTNNTVYPLAGGSVTITPNTAIQNVLDGDTAYNTPYSYQGTGTRIAPQKSGQKIIVQDNNSFYTFTGDFNYENLNLKLECSVVATTSGYLIDMDNPLYFNANNGRFLITIIENKLLQFTDSLGFRNSGNTSSIPPSFDSGRIGFIHGEGTLYSSYSGANILTRYIFNGDGNNNDDNVHFEIRCKVRADQQGIYLTKNKMRIDFYNLLQSGILTGSGNIALKAFHMTGGQIRFYEKGSIDLSNHVTGRTYGFTFEPIDDGIGYCNFQLNSAKVAGNSENCFAKLNNEAVGFLAFNSPSGDGFSTTLVGTGTIVDGLFENLGVTPWEVNFKNNVFSFTGIDQTKVDLTQGNNVSTINFIGNNLVENLVVYGSKANALAAGIPINSTFLKRNVFNAVDLIAGVEYKVVTAGSPSLGTVGSFFTATGSETGTGTASLETREIIT
jgi:hypothetical protein